MSLLGQIFSKVNPNALRAYMMQEYEDELKYRHILPDYGVKSRFLCVREMIRDFDKEVRMGDGYAYWCTTGRLIVTWDNGNVTYIETYEKPHSPVVIDCGYDEGLPF